MAHNEAWLWMGHQQTSKTFIHVKHNNKATCQGDPFH